MTKKRGSDDVLSRSEGMTKKKGQNDKKRRSRMTSLLCHPEAKPKGLLRRFFPFAIAYSEKNEILHSADAPFRMTEKGGSDDVLSRSPKPKP